MFRAVIFDLGGVLVDNPWPGMVNHYAAYFGVSEEVFLKACAQFADDWQRGVFSEEVFWNKIAQELQAEKSGGNGLWIEGLKKVYREKKEILDLVSRLKSEGYKTGLLSNTEMPVVDFLAEQVYPPFDTQSYSCVLGMIKPQKEIYLVTCERLGIAPSEAIFIDDKPENIVGAKQVGLEGVVFETSEQVAADLKNLLSA
jgi:putative hydrolase of the HAD superfamily